MYADNDLIGTINFPKFLSTKGDITILGHELEADSPSMWKSRMELRDKKSGKLVAELKIEKLFGESEITVGTKTFQFATTFFQKRFFIKSDTGATLIEFKMLGSFRTECEILPEPTFLSVEEFPLLLVFVWYLIIRISNRRSAAGV
ncbi:MAG: hypothetical protein IPJ75_00470 [Ignavibacteriales bacterium]|nr:hypothetical protein [Ignavibacteriales bacterium]